MGKGRRLNVITAILKINAACSTLTSDCTEKAGQRQRETGSRQRLQELKQNKKVTQCTQISVVEARHRDKMFPRVEMQHIQ